MLGELGVLASAESGMEEGVLPAGPLKGDAGVVKPLVLGLSAVGGGADPDPGLKKPGVPAGGAAAGGAVVPDVGGNSPDEGGSRGVLGVLGALGVLGSGVATPSSGVVSTGVPAQSAPNLLFLDLYSFQNEL